MSEGTSQGLFIVVAIVVFGIFIGLAYTAFGSEGLTNDLKGIFENGVEKTTTPLENVAIENIAKLKDSDLSGNILKAGDMTFRNTKSEELIGNTALFSIETGKSLSGLMFQPELFNTVDTYILEYDLTLTEGAMNYFGGHNAFSTDTAFINGKIVGSMHDAFRYNFKLNEKVHMKVIYSKYGERDVSDKRIYIQPNRPNYGTDITVKLENISIRKVLK